jgi:hypothetical protein
MAFVSATTHGRMASMLAPPCSTAPSATHLRADTAHQPDAAGFPKHEIEIGITHRAIQFAPLRCFDFDFTIDYYGPIPGGE